MRILVHDYSGHPFQVQLSRWLAAQGHQAQHLYAADVETPRGAVTRRDDDPAGFSVDAIGTGQPLPKYDLVRRWQRERAYARALSARCRAFAPEVVLSTGPPTIQNALRRTTVRAGGAYVCWLQDIYALAVAPVLRRRFPIIGALVARGFRAYENTLLRRSDAVVLITEDFAPLLTAAGVDGDRLTVIPNWAPLDEVRTAGKDNDWARRHGLDDKLVFLYAGTLGLKHNPALLADLAEALPAVPAARVVVVTQGLGRAFLEKEKADRSLDRLFLLDYAPYERLPEVLGTADVVLALLEAYADVLSVPSKILTYLCAGKPILAAMPDTNLAARTIAGAGAGRVVGPADSDGFVAAARDLCGDPDARRRMGRNARRHAESTFDIDRIGARFLTVLEAARRGAADRRRGHSACDDQDCA